MRHEQYQGGLNSNNRPGHEATKRPDHGPSMATRVIYCLIAAGLICLLGMVPSTWADDSTQPEKEGFYDKLGDRKWAVTVYGGRLAEEDIEDLYTLSASYSKSSYLFTAALARRMASFFNDGLIFELEGQVVKHFDYMDHWEINGLGIFRLPFFSKSDFLNMSLAWGGGLSYATEVPANEIEEAIEDGGDAEKLLFYMMVELTFNLPQAPQWNILLRLHHRSGAAGTLGDSGSNFVCAGLKYYF